jgi:uncharacterized protein (DUF58 family)
VLRGDQLEASLRTLELDIRRRLDGLLQGNHVGLVPGPGGEPGEARQYFAGDDVRHMDWAVTARTTEPHIRQTVADRELETWLAVDLSPSLNFGTTGSTKKDLAICAAAAFSQLTMGGGNRVGAVIATGAKTIRVPAKGGAAHSHRLVKDIAELDEAADGHRGDLTELLAQLQRPPRRRGLVVVISDFVGEPTWVRELRGLAARHSVIAVEVIDPRDVELPDSGSVVLADPESGRQREIRLTTTVRRDFAAASAAHRKSVATALRTAGAGHLVLRTDSDWIADTVRFAIARKRHWTNGA